MTEPASIPAPRQGFDIHQDGVRVPAVPASANAGYCATRGGQWVKLVREFVKLLQFGEVHLSVHKGRVVEVRKIEKVRFDE